MFVNACARQVFVVICRVAGLENGSCLGYLLSLSLVEWNDNASQATTKCLQMMLFVTKPMVLGGCHGRMKLIGNFNFNFNFNLNLRRLIFH